MATVVDAVGPSSEHATNASIVNNTVRITGLETRIGCTVLVAFVISGPSLVNEWRRRPGSGGKRHHPVESFPGNPTVVGFHRHFNGNMAYAVAPLWRGAGDGSP